MFIKHWTELYGMNLKKAAKGIDSRNLETRIKSSIFLLNLEKTGKAHYSFEIRKKLLEKFNADVLALPPNSLYLLVGMDDRRRMLDALCDIAVKREPKCGLAAIQMVIFSGDLNEEAKYLSCIIRKTPHKTVKNEAIRALSISLNTYLKSAKSFWLASYSPITYVAGFGDDVSSARAFKEITACKSLDAKFYSLCKIADNGGKLRTEAVKLIYNSFDEIAEMPANSFVKSDALKILVYGPSENLALKALEQLNECVKAQDLGPGKLETIAEVMRNPAIVAKAKEYLAQYPTKSLGDEIAGCLITDGS